jgi:hypothetical protein
MKKIILTTLSFIIIGCWWTQVENKTYKYTLRNESGKNIKVNAFRTFYPPRETPIITILDDEEELIKTHTEASQPDVFNFISFFNGDSLIVNFNNERKQIFTFPTENERNPFYHSGTNVIFVFTQQDFENAEDCNGNCD